MLKDVLVRPPSEGVNVGALGGTNEHPARHQPAKGGVERVRIGVRQQVGEVGLGKNGRRIQGVVVQRMNAVDLSHNRLWFQISTRKT